MLKEIVILTVISLFIAYIAWLHLEIYNMKKEKCDCISIDVDSLTSPDLLTLDEYLGVQESKILYSY